MIQRFSYFIAGVLLSSIMANFAAPAAGTTAAEQVDILIVHGKLVDGSGRKARNADVGIRGDRIGRFRA